GRKQGQKLERDRVDAARGDDVAGERGAILTRPVLQSGQRVVHLMSGVAAQVTGAKSGVRDTYQVGVGLVIRGPQVIREKEKLIVFDRSADVAAKVVVGEVADRRVEERAGVKGAVLQELVSCA